jgi:hypothetical protein
MLKAHFGQGDRFLFHRSMLIQSERGELVANCSDWIASSVGRKPRCFNSPPDESQRSF